ncbi:MAG: hypothetical protein QNJ47_28225 [Nostocaceae cyanobacterium]|nr:hypothetical protein [Nostocaceae cyanobacterium]
MSFLVLSAEPKSPFAFNIYWAAVGCNPFNSNERTGRNYPDKVAILAGFAREVTNKQL